MDQPWPEHELRGYARSVAVALVVQGPMPRARVILLLRKFGLDEQGAEAAVALGLAERILDEDGGKIRAGPER